MSQSNYKITITDHDYYYTTYTAWVQAYGNKVEATRL